MVQHLTRNLALPLKIMSPTHWLKRFLDILPRFFVEMVIGGVVLFLLACVSGIMSGILAIVIEVFQLQQLKWIGKLISWPFQMIFLTLNFPLLYFFENLFEFFLHEQNKENFGFTVVLPTIVVYDCFLFAVFCESIRYFTKRKKHTETLTEPQALDCDVCAQSKDCGSDSKSYIL